MPSIHEQPRDTPSGSRSPLHRSDGGSSRRAAATAVPLSDGRASGELEGSTLGSSSREGERRVQGHRRVQSSSEFLLDSLPRSKSSRITSHRSRPSEPPTEKHGAPEPDIVVSKKRSRFPWKRHKHSAAEANSDGPSSSQAAAQQTSTPPSEAQSSRASPRAEIGVNNTETPGLDRDSIQIVNLALNLNESRRRTASGLPLGSNGRRPISVSQPVSSPVTLHTPASGASTGQHYRNYSQVQGDHLSPAAQPGGQSPVVELLPPTAVDNNRVFEFSESTFARAERARRHFDLFYEYIRLLPLLPPLRTPAQDVSEYSQAAAAASSINRGYNPLQMIRNRRVRYRDKCPIDAEAEGWHDFGKVHEWVNSIEAKYGHKTHDQTQSIKLPSFQQGQRHESHGEPDDVDMFAASPPSSLRRISRTNSIKAPRPRLDWKFSPAELLADAAWLEDSANKAKIIDKDGNKLYPDPTELVLMDTNTDTAANQKQRLSVEMTDPVEESSRASLSSYRPALAPEFKSIGRGRHRHRFRGHPHSPRSRSASSSRKPSRWDKVRMRGDCVSSDSSAERRDSLDERHRTWGHSRKDSERISQKEAANSLGSRVTRAKSPAAAIYNVEQSQSQPSEPPSISTKASNANRKASFSSAGSLDNRTDPRMSLEGMDSTAPNSPVHAGYFPSIAVNLSPPSSRSPSPAKRGLRHKIVSRHERSKSKQGIRELRGHEFETLDTDSLPNQIMTHPPTYGERPSKLEPSPLPDVVSSAHADEQGLVEGSRFDNSRGRKAQYLPESKLRGLFKGPGRIAELVGNEVSKVGDLILKKEPPPDTRKSSSATTLGSEDSDSDDEEKRADKRPGPKGLLRRLPTFADEPGRLVRRETDKGAPSRSFMPSLTAFTSPLRQDDSGESTGTLAFGSPRERVPTSRRQDDRDGAKRMPLSRSKTLDFDPAVHSSRGRLKPHAIKDASVPFSLTRPPVTGLAHARASQRPTPEKRPRFSGASRAWSISDRSIQTLNDSGVPGKTEIERTRTLLLSSGIKAREITRRAHSVRDPPPHWLQSSLGSGASISRVTRIGEFDLAAQNLLRRFEATQYSFQQSMHHFTTSTSSPLRSQLKELETLVNQSLTPRVRATADDAEDLCVQLNTTSTLAVKSLSDALDKGLRKRRRRLRWVRRAGFVILEWALVGILWWVWLIVMAFKLVRGIFRGTVSGARWILWL